MGFRLPIALNPFKSRVPSTRLGKVGKFLNPLNPVNAATMLLEETLGGLVGGTLGPEARQRLEYFTFGPFVGTALNVLDAGPVSANEDQLVRDAQARYLQEQQKQSKAGNGFTQPATGTVTYGPTGAPIGGVGGGNAGASVQPPLGPAPATRRPAEEQHPPVTREVPASPTPPPAEAPSMNELAQLYARQRVLGTEMAKGGELQRRLYEGGAAEGMPIEKFMTWVEAHPDLAYRLAEKRGLLPQYD